MTYEIATYTPYSVVLVPFPFTDKKYEKKRPAIVLSSTQHQKNTGHITLLMITSAKNSSWPSDHLIKHLDETGLNAASLIRQKIFTIDSRLVIKSTGRLHKNDKEAVLKALQKHLSLL